MRDPTEALSDIERLQRALEAVSADLDAIEQRPHFLLRRAAETLEYDSPNGIESFIDHFAFAVKRGSLVQPGQPTQP
jgi:hypothetical protein